jgi:hypothetical protein
VRSPAADAPARSTSSTTPRSVCGVAIPIPAGNAAQSTSHQRTIPTAQRSCSRHYREWDEWYFSKRFLTVEQIRPIYDYRPLTDALVAALTPDVILDDDPENPHLRVEDYLDDVQEIGYPVEEIRS